jgi:ribosomal protein L23
VAPSAVGSSAYDVAWRKAVVTLAAGQKIEFFEGV